VDQLGVVEVLWTTVQPVIVVVVLVVVFLDDAQLDAEPLEFAHHLFLDQVE